MAKSRSGSKGKKIHCRRSRSTSRGKKGTYRKCKKGEKRVR